MTELNKNKDLQALESKKSIPISFYMDSGWASVAPTQRYGTSLRFSTRSWRVLKFTS